VQVCLQEVLLPGFASEQDVPDGQEEHDEPV